MQRWSDGLGRTIIIAGIAGSLFAGFLALAPRLTASNATPTPAAPAPAAPLAESVSLPSISDPVIAVAADPMDAVEAPGTATAGPAVIETPLISMATSSTTSTVAQTTTNNTPVAALDGSITLTIETRAAGDSDAAAPFVEGDEIEWRFVVTNTSGEELWGTYAYLEHHGRVPCDATNLQPGESTDCWIVTRAVEGAHTAEAWATAWTTDRLVAAEVDYILAVTR